MKIITYNVNGLRASIRKGFIEWLVEEQPDVICLQELKADLSVLPTECFERLGYYCTWFCADRKGYSGVGILTKQLPKNISYGLGNSDFDKEGRFVTLELGSLTIGSVYFPNGYGNLDRLEYKRDWMAAFDKKISNILREKKDIIISGDFNMCHSVLDVHEEAFMQKNESFFLENEKQWMEAFLNKGFVDSFRYIHPNKKTFSWWSMLRKAKERNQGWRIDYHMVSKNLQSRIKDVGMYNHVHFSDHCPVWLEIE